MLEKIKRYIANIASKTTENRRKVWVFQSDPKRNPQSFELAKKLTSLTNIVKILDSRSILSELKLKPSLMPDIAIGCGRECHESLLEIKRLHPHTKTISIIDNGHAPLGFDLIVTPSYEPHSKGHNIVETTGLINFISPTVLANELKLYKTGAKHQKLSTLGLQGPFIAVMIGGFHTGGNITAVDAEKLARQLNDFATKRNATLLISSSARTESATIDSLERHLNANYFIYDYKHGRSIENPYTLFLALADDVVVTGDSIRMMSEACSSGKNVYIFDSENIGFQYKSLSKELVANSYAYYFTTENLNAEAKTTTLNEAARVAEIIKQKFYAEPDRNS
jgi:mitochondrial fission protein ELM1